MENNLKTKGPETQVIYMNAGWYSVTDLEKIIARVHEGRNKDKKPTE